MHRSRENLEIRVSEIMVGILFWIFIWYIEQINPMKRVLDHLLNTIYYQLNLISFLKFTSSNCQVSPYTFVITVNYVYENIWHCIYSLFFLLLRGTNWRQELLVWLFRNSNDQTIFFLWKRQTKPHIRTWYIKDDIST